MKRIAEITVLIICSLMLCIPIVFMNHSNGIVAKGENRYLAGMPHLFLDDGSLNKDYSSEFETWVNDNIGFRQQMIDFDAKIQYSLFHNITRGAMYLGKNDDLIFATDDMLRHYQQLDLKSDEELTYIADSYQLMANRIRDTGSQFYYIQCYDKHSIYPEQFMKYVNQIGDISRTDQIIGALNNQTDIPMIDLKECMLDAKKNYEVYSNWGDPTHWSFRGAFVGYSEIMRIINANNNNRYKVLDESDYNIQMGDGGYCLLGGAHHEDILEIFTLLEPKAEPADFYNWMMVYTTRKGTQPLHFINHSVDNDTKLLIMGDSYLRDYIADDIAESFAETIVLGTGLDNVLELDDIMSAYQPDITIFECGERADTSFIVGIYAEQERDK